jgi:hypothetical protein
MSDISTSFETTYVPAKRNAVEDQLERSISAVSVEQVPERKGPRKDWSLTAGCMKNRDV